MGTTLRNFAGHQYQHLIGVADGAEAVGDDKAGAFGHQLVQGCLKEGCGWHHWEQVDSSWHDEFVEVRVTDDGSGMSAEDAALAVRRHATSKLRTGEDLFHIATLGFRGEALPTIARVSKLTLSTRGAEELGGVQIEVAGGAILDSSPVGTFALLLVFAALMLAGWGYMFFYMFLEHGPVN